MIVFLWSLLSISEKLPEANICFLSGDSWIDSTAPVPQAVSPEEEQVLPPLPISPAPVEVGGWKPLSITPVRASRAMIFDRFQMQRFCGVRVESLCCGVPQLASLSG